MCKQAELSCRDRRQAGILHSLSRQQWAKHLSNLLSHKIVAPVCEVQSVVKQLCTLFFRPTDVGHLAFCMQRAEKQSALLKHSGPMPFGTPPVQAVPLVPTHANTQQ